MKMNSAGTTEESALRNIGREKLRNALRKLRKQDAYLIWLLYFEEIKVKEAAVIFRCSRKAIGNQRKRILQNLYKMIGEGIT